MTDIRDILNDGTGNLSEDKLLAYLEGRLSAEEQHEVERMLNAEGMESDSLEGLKAMAVDDAKQSVTKLNKKLNDSLNIHKRARKKPIKGNFWALIAVVVILLVCLAAYGVFMVMLKK